MYTRYRKLRAGDVLPFPEGVTPKQGASAFVIPLTALGMISTMRLEGHKGWCTQPPRPTSARCSTSCASPISRSPACTRLFAVSSRAWRSLRAKLDLPTGAVVGIAAIPCRENCMVMIITFGCWFVQLPIGR